jgi:hypothetical protein
LAERYNNPLPTLEDVSARNGTALETQKTLGLD